MIITVLSEKLAIQYSKLVKNKCIFVSITCPNEKNVSFYSNENIKAIFDMKFNDIDDSDWYVNGVKIESPKQKDFEGLKYFLDNNIDETIEEIVVHCGAGVSRSAGTALAIAEYLNIPNDIATSKNYEPNFWVNKLAKIELGIYKDENYYNEVFK